MEKMVVSGSQDNKYNIIKCSDDTEKKLALLFEKYVLSQPEEEIEESRKRFKEIEKRNNNIWKEKK